MHHLPLVTSRLTLRKFRPSDWKSVHEYAKDPQTVKYTTFGPNTPAQTKEFIQKSRNLYRSTTKTNLNLAITLTQTGQLIGGCRITIEPPARNKTASIGIVLNKKYWGQGYGTEVATALLTYAFTKLKLHRVKAALRPQNTSSKKIVEKVGMRQEGYMVQNSFYKGTWHDSLHFAILKGEALYDTDCL